MNPLRLTLACGEYDRTRALADGSLAPERIELEYITARPGPLFHRMVRERTYEVAEMSFASYLNLRARGDEGLIGVPVFPSRLFRHGYVFVNSSGRIQSAPDLAGARIGTEQYQLTASVWLRGIFDDEAGVRPEDVTWVVGGQDEPGGGERAPLTLPDGIAVERIGADETLSTLLAEGRIDALFAPHLPAIFQKRDPRVVRLFPDYPAVEADYYRRTGLFPIMHLVVIRSDVYEANRWVAGALFEAFCESKRRALERLRFAGTLAAMVPWLIADLEAAEDLFGERYWPYGVAANRPELETLIRYAHRQGITVRDLTVDELFAPETLVMEDAVG